ELVGLTFSSPSSTASAHPLSLHDALPISPADDGALDVLLVGSDSRTDAQGNPLPESVLKELRTESTSGLNTDTLIVVRIPHNGRDRKSTRLNSSHVKTSYAVFCLKKKRDK